ncbi:MAG: hypothetical protein ACTSSI_15600 [Candidatus Helarchaeota archaeon]
MWLWALNRKLFLKMNFNELKADSISVIEGFFSNLFITDSYCYKILKNRHQKEREILGFEFHLGLCYSPEIYEAIIPIDSEKGGRYALKMKRIDGITLQDWIRNNRRKKDSKDYLAEISRIYDKILERIENASKHVFHIPVSTLTNFEFMENYYFTLKNSFLETKLDINDINIDLNFARLDDIFLNKLAGFIQNFDFEMVPQMHGDLNPSNIIVSDECPVEIFIIDPYNPYLQRSSDEILGIPLNFSYFYDICYLKVTLEGFAHKKNSINLYKKAFRTISFLKRYKDKPEMMGVWEILVNLRNVVIFNYNIEFAYGASAEDIHLYKVLIRKYIQNLKNITIDEL